MAPTGEDEFVDFFRAEYPGIVGELSLILGDRSRAEDAAQEAFARAFARWRRLSSYERPGAWVRRVAIRVATRVRNPRMLLVGAVSDGKRTVTPERGRDLDLAQAIGKLPPAQRVAVVLHYLRDLPVAEVAEALGCKEATARVHLHRARGSLATMLDEEVPSEAR